MRHITSSAISNIGNIMSNNEDNMYINGEFKVLDNEATECVINCEDNKGYNTFGVFDGIGGASLGEMASYIAASNLVKYDCDALETRMSNYIDYINDQVCLTKKERKLRSMGTTLALIHFSETSVFICNIGDSRVYRYRDNTLEQLSFDHTSERFDLMSGILSSSNKSHTLTQHIGIEADEFIIEPYSSSIEYKHGDIYLLCSDGLYNELSDESIKTIIAKENSPKECCRSLIDNALLNGGRDNTTAIVVKVE